MRKSRYSRSFFEGHDCCNSRWIETGGSDGERGSAGRFCIFGIWQSAGVAGRGGRGDIQSPPTGAAAPFTAGSADKTLRGNVQTRLRHLDEGNYDAVILAAAGLKRLGLQERIQSYISTCDSIPAAGQGVMAIETRIGDDETMEIIQFIHDEKVASCIMAERAFLEKVGGDCKVPAGIYAVPFLGHIEAVAFIGSPDGKEMYKRSLNGQTQDAKQLGESLAEALIADGGGRILEELRK